MTLTATTPELEHGWWTVVILRGWRRVAVLMADDEAGVLEMAGRWVDG